MRKKGKMHPACLEEIYQKFLEYWDTPDFKAASQKASASRKANPKMHTGGSRSYADYRNDLMGKEGEEPTAWQVYCKTHKVESGEGSTTSGWIDHASEEFAAEYDIEIKRLESEGQEITVDIEETVFRSLTDKHTKRRDRRPNVGNISTESGDLMKPDRAVDGIFGFGQHELSVISQSSSAGVAPKVFSHCLKGSGNGGGILVLGEIVEPGIVYTPLVPSAPHYNLNLHSIAVNGQQLNIDSSAFTTSATQGTIIDSGTTLAYFSEQVYDTFVNTIISSLQPSLVQSFDGIKDNRCFIAAGSVDDAFPPVTLNFVGGATMSLKASDYLLPQGTVNSDIIWCIGWQKSEGGTTILGDLVLKDKIVVYDLANQRIGWKNYDCSLSVNVSSSSGKSEFVNNSGQQFDMSSSSSHMSNRSLPTSFILFVVHVCVFIINLL